MALLLIGARELWSRFVCKNAMCRYWFKIQIFPPCLSDLLMSCRLPYLLLCLCVLSTASAYDLSSAASSNSTGRRGYYDYSARDDDLESMSVRSSSVKRLSGAPDKVEVLYYRWAVFMKRRGLIPSHTSANSIGSSKLLSLSRISRYIMIMWTTVEFSKIFTEAVAMRRNREPLSSMVRSFPCLFWRIL